MALYEILYSLRKRFLENDKYLRKYSRYGNCQGKKLTVNYHGNFTVNNNFILKYLNNYSI